MKTSVTTLSTAAFLSVMLVAPAMAAISVPHIRNVAFSGKNGNFTATITGTDFGVVPDGIPCNACTPLQLQVVDIVSQPAQQVINVTSWSDTRGGVPPSSSFTEYIVDLRSGRSA